MITIDWTSAFPGRLCLALGAFALCEVLRCGVLALGVGWRERVGWMTVCTCLWLAMDRAAWHDADVFRVHLAFVSVCALGAGGWVLLRRPGAAPGLLAGHGGAVLGTVAWLVSTAAEEGIYGTGSSYVAVLGETTGAVGLLLLARGGWRLVRGGRGARLWPVREEVVGRRLWRFVRPRTVLIAVSLSLIFFGPVVGGTFAPYAIFGDYFLLAILVFPLLGFPSSYLGRRLRPLRYTPRPDEGFLLIEALAAAAILAFVLAAATAAIAHHERMGRELVDDATARRLLRGEMERLRALPFAEVERLRGKTGRAISSGGLGGATIETEIGPEEDDGVWRVAVTIRWRGASGSVGARRLETLRARAGGPS